MKLIYLIVSLFVLLAGTKNFLNDDGVNAASDVSEAEVVAAIHSTKAVSAQGVISAYFNKKLVAINYKYFTDESARVLLDQHRTLNIIYTSDVPVRIVGNSKRMFTPVVDVIGESGSNTVWLEEQITFNPGFSPRQFFSDDQIDAAASGPNPEITIAPTGTVYRCSLAEKIDS